MHGASDVAPGVPLSDALIRFLCLPMTVVRWPCASASKRSYDDVCPSGGNIEQDTNATCTTSAQL